MAARKAPPPPAEGLLDLFGGQDIPMPTVQPVEPTWGALEGQVKWLKPLAGRHLCDDCTVHVHAGKGGTPLAATARRVGPVGVLHLCPVHAQTHREADARAEREYRARQAVKEHQARRR